MTTQDRIAERERKGIPQSTPTGFAIPRSPVCSKCGTEAPDATDLLPWCDPCKAEQLNGPSRLTPKPLAEQF
jgi:hypothetical protein